MKNSVLSAISIVFATFSLFGNQSQNPTNQYNVELYSNEYMAEELPIVGVDHDRSLSRKLYTEKLDSSVLYSQNMNVNVSKFEYSFDDSGRVSLKQYFEWLDGKWAVKKKYVYDYNQFGYSDAITMYNWSLDQLVPFYKAEYSYDQQGHFIGSIQYRWSENTWVANTKFSCDVNEFGGIKSQIYYQPVNNQWVEYEMFDKQYDTLGNVTSEMHYVWTNNQWVGDRKTANSYNVDGNISLQKLSYKSMDKWIDTSYTAYEYDGSGNLLSSTTSSMDNISGWIDITKMKFSYDLYGNVLVDSSFTSSDGSYFRVYKIQDYTYDISTWKSSIMVEHDVVEKSKHKCLSKKELKDPDFSPITLASKYYYSPVTTTSLVTPAVTSSKVVGFILSGSELTFSAVLPVGTVVNIFDLAGRKVHSADVEGVSLSLPSLGKGVYVVSVDIRKAIHNCKLVIN